MKITEITVSAGRVIPHPRQSFANLRPMISLRASLDDGEDAYAAAVALWHQANWSLNDHIIKVLADIEAECQAERKRQDEAYEQRQRERLAASAGGNADALEDDEVDELEDEETPFEV